MDYGARPGFCLGSGKGLVASAGGGAPALCVGLGGARIIVILLACGVSASQADRSGRVGEGAGDRFSLSVAVSISSPVGGGCNTFGDGAERLIVGGAGQLGPSFNRAVCSAPQLTQRDGEEEQQPGVALRLPPLEQVGFGHRWFEQE